MKDSLSLAICNDSLSHPIGYIVKENSILDNICSIATITIAVINVLLLVYIFRQEAKNSEKENDKARKWDFLLNVIIQPNLSHLYGFFNKVDAETSKLLNLSDIDAKQVINSNIIDLATSFRKDFLILLSVVDKNLYDSSLKIIDDFIDALTISIFDKGINLTYPPKFEDEISNRVVSCKQALLSNIYSAAEFK